MSTPITYERTFGCPRDAWRSWALLAAEVGAGEYPLGVLRGIAYRPALSGAHWRLSGELACEIHDAERGATGGLKCQRPTEPDDAGWTWYGAGRTRIGILDLTVRLAVREDLLGEGRRSYASVDEHPRVQLAAWLGLSRAAGNASGKCIDCGATRPHDSAYYCGRCHDELKRIGGGPI